ncbi:peptide/nickel transport system permease protein [Sinosporangium album]|uniref:Peptide/nickel transport system permease protein n=1 Tax=Sinosporangium album TaxID=504805 RepID=A0A1G8B1I8_9ACTN|nr:ABC transporter permease [Sinosporangium album]SDH27048.1 peptide/nickel transport system permease protein [Sinosporangium album]
MLRFLARLGNALFTLLIATAVVFLGVRALPGDPAVALLGEEGDPAALEAVREQYGLDQPVIVQFVKYLQQIVTGNLGDSVRTGLPVTDVIAGAVPVTLELTVVSMLVAVVIGVTTGVVAALYRGRVAGWVVSVAALIGLSVPSFWLGLMAILVFAIMIPILPASGFVPIDIDPVGHVTHLVMPALVLGTAFAAVIMRQTRAAMLEALTTDYVRTATAKGLRRRHVVMRHALRNSLIVVVTIVGLQLGTLIAGAVVTEQVFVIPGFGKLMIDAVATRDYPLIQGVVLITATAYIVINLLTDLLYTVVDPRVRVTAGEAA